jgi:hypothetical protein
MHDAERVITWIAAPLCQEDMVNRESDDRCWRGSGHHRIGYSMAVGRSEP